MKMRNSLLKSESTRFYKMKKRIVYFLTNFLFILSLFFLIGQFGLYPILGMQVTIKPVDIFFILGFFVYATVLRFVLLKKNLQLAFILITIVFMLITFSTILENGATYPYAYLFFVLLLIASGIILDRKKTILIFFLIVFMIVSITALHNLHIVDYKIMQIGSHFWAGVYITLTLIIITTTVRFAYAGIDKIYKKASNLAHQFETLNNELDKKIALRTKQIKQSLDEKIQTMLNLAIVGRITSPLLFNLESPVNNIGEKLPKISEKNLDKKSRKYFEIATEATSQMARIIKSGKDLINQRLQVTEFSPSEIIQIILFILRNDLFKNSIRVKVKISKKIKLQGLVTIFERIVMNILQNAIEELAYCKKRQLEILGSKNDKYFVLTIKDSGRGIKKKHIKRIFDPDFSLKEGHLGLGLPFVKSIIDKKFGGKVEIESKLGKYTKFILYFKLIEK
jgi:signal transduction histidine kinase